MLFPPSSPVTPGMAVTFPRTNGEGENAAEVVDHMYKNGIRDFYRDNRIMHRIVIKFIHGTTQKGREYGSLILSIIYVFHNPLLLIIRKSNLSFKMLNESNPTMRRIPFRQ